MCLQGYEAVSVSRIAGTLGMTKGALYRHYENEP
ncbi:MULTISPECIES: TetR family transcriptional regulator [Lachnospiraceae]